MSRTKATLIIAIIASSSFAQAVSPNDPVERMTDRIMRTFMPSAFRAPFSPAPTTLRAEPVDRLQPAEDTRSTQKRRPKTQLRSEFDETRERSLEPAFEPAQEPLPAFDMMPIPRGFRMFPMMDFAPRAFASDSFSSSRQGFASSKAGTQTAPMPRAPLPPAPLSFSRATSNGLHAIQAVVPTENGAKRVELKGTSAEVRRQVEALPKSIRPMMENALGY